ncbi:MAG: type I-E CRISPR-associated protein Cas7/Cse4/CasC [Syntrophales bacterium]
MLIEIHMIQNHSPANLNRDDLGAPKTCIFGGVTRARISSQCLKRSIRRSTEFSAALEKDGGVRTRRLIELIAKAAGGKGDPPKKEHCEAIRKVFTEGGVGLKDENTFDILFFLPQSAINKMGTAVREGNGNLGDKFAKIIREFIKTPDIALCGRMTEFDAKGPFEGLKGLFTVEAALSAAHAISTHAVVNEVDYFTAADDVPGQDAGAAHVNEAMFISACFYKHFVIDFEQLKKNLANDADLACKTVRCFLEAATKANPSGKQHAFAAFNLPDGVLVELKTNTATPISYANAFADPVPEKSERGLIGESIARLGQYARDLVEGYGIEAQRFWYSPSLRQRLTWIDKSKKEPEQEQSVVGSDEFGKFDQFVNAIMKKVEATRTVVGAAK